MAKLTFSNGAVANVRLIQGPKLHFFNEKGEWMGDGNIMRRNAREYKEVKVIENAWYSHGYMGAWCDPCVMVEEKSFNKAVKTREKRLKKA